MKIILSESQIHKIRENNPDFIIAPYPNPKDYQYYDPEGYKRSKELGTLNLFYPNIEPDPKKGRGRPKLEKPQFLSKSIDPPKRNKSNLINTGINLNKEYSDEELVNELKKYRGRADVDRNDHKLYIYILKENPNLFKIAFPHPKPKYSIKDLENTAKQYNNVQEFETSQNEMYIYCLENNILKYLFSIPKKGRGREIMWTLDNLRNVAKKYKTRMSFAQNENSAYTTIRRFPGFIDELFPI